MEPYLISYDLKLWQLFYFRTMAVLINGFYARALAWYECTTEDYKTYDLILYNYSGYQSLIPERMTITKEKNIWLSIGYKDLRFYEDLIQQLGECIEGMQRSGEF